MGRPIPQNKNKQKIPFLASDVNPQFPIHLPLLLLLLHVHLVGSLHLKLATQGVQLLNNGRLGVDLLKLSILELLTTSKAHLQVLNGPDLLLKTANLLGVGIL